MMKNRAAIYGNFLAKQERFFKKLISYEGWPEPTSFKTLAHWLCLYGLFESNFGMNMNYF